MVRVKSVPQKKVFPKPKLYKRKVLNTNPGRSQGETPEPLVSSASTPLSRDPAASTSPVDNVAYNTPKNKSHNSKSESELPPAKKPRLPVKSKKLKCRVDGCDFESSRHDARDAHMEQHTCNKCAQEELDMADHECQNADGSDCYGPQPFDIRSSVFRESQRAHRGSLIYYTYQPKEKVCLVSKLVNDVKVPLLDLLHDLIDYFKGFRLKIIIQFDLFEVSFDITKTTYIPSEWVVISHKDFVPQAIFQCISRILSKLNVYSERKSDWQVLACKSLDVHIGQLNRIPGRAFIKIPKELSYKQGLINIKNKGSNCFALCILAAIYGESIVESYIQAKKAAGTLPLEGSSAYSNLIRDKLSGPRQYERLLKTNKSIDFSGLTYTEEKGVSLESITGFEEKNPNISVTVYGNEGKNLIPIRNTQHVRNTHINLLLLTVGEKAHYIWMRQSSRTLGKRSFHSHIFCPMCNRKFITPEVLERHKAECGLRENPTQITNPPIEDFLRFKQWEQTLWNHYCLYYYFHFFKKKDEEAPVPMAYTLLLVGPLNHEKVEFYAGDKVMLHFLKRSLALAREVVDRVSKTNIPPIVTPREMEIFQNAKICDLCWLPFSAMDQKVLHHSHADGLIVSGNRGGVKGKKTTGALHNSCNLQVKIPPFLNAISVNSNDFFKSLLVTGWDNRVLFKSVPLTHKNGHIIGLKLNNILKLNNLQNFNDKSISVLVSQTVEAGGPLPHLKKLFPKKCKSFMDIAGKDFCYPTQYSLDELRDIDNSVSYCRYMPKKSFDSSSAFCTEEQYSNYRLIMREFDLKSVDEYLEIYLKLKCFSVADVFQYFRKHSFYESGLDALYSWTFASYSMSCCLFKNRIEIEYMKDQGQAEMTEKLIKAGVTTITKQMVNTNSVRSIEYDCNKPAVELLEVDRTLSYGSVLLQPIPVGGYEWMTQEELDSFDYFNPPLNSGYGYVFECCLTLPPEFHTYYRDFPLWPQKMEIIIANSKRFFTENSSSNRVVTKERNILSFFDKTDDCFYYKSLSFMLRHNYKLISVSRGFKFKEEAVLAPYVQYHVDCRKNATCQLQKDNHKNYINVLFGKFLSSNLSYPTHEFCFTQTRAKQLLARDKFSDVEILAENLSLFHIAKGKGTDFNVRLVGAIVLELGKLALYECFYDKIKISFPDSRLVLSNTDSLLVQVPDKRLDFYERLKKVKNTFDFSNLPVTHPLFSEENKGIPGFWKMVHINIKEFVGTRVTSYSLKFGNEVVDYKCAGSSKGYLNYAERHEEIKKSVLAYEEKRVEIIAVKLLGKQKLGIKLDQVDLTGLENNRLWFSPGQSVPFGYKGELPMEGIVAYAM